MRARALPSTLFTFFLLGLVGMAVLAARGWTPQARLLPLVVGVPTLLLVGGQFFVDILYVVKPRMARRKSGGLVDIPVDESVPIRVVVVRAVEAFSWVIGLGVAVALIGFVVALPVFVLVYLLVHARDSLVGVLGGTTVVVAVLLGVFDRVLDMVWPTPYFPGPQEFVLSLIS